MITSYFYKDVRPTGGWTFSKIPLDSINLFVGPSGSGKSRLLNTIFNLSRYLVAGGGVTSGHWELDIDTGQYAYRWLFRINNEQDESYVEEERLDRLDRNQGGWTTIVDRNKLSFMYNNSTLPKLEKGKSSITLLREEDLIKPFYDSFSRIFRRNFHEEGLADARSVQNISHDIIQQIRSRQDGGEPSLNEFAVGTKLYILKECFPTKYETIVTTYREVFPSITDCDIKIQKHPDIRIEPEGFFPIFCIREKGVDSWLPLQELSSGMQKVLLIISDVLTLPKGSIYLIDEYENSLGVNAIDFLPTFLQQYGSHLQFFITTHHPYLINSMPIKLWRIFQRIGSQVTIRPGHEIEERYGKSKQKAFIQLINDPIYTGDAL